MQENLRSSRSSSKSTKKTEQLWNSDLKNSLNYGNVIPQNFHLAWNWWRIFLGKRRTLFCFIPFCRDMIQSKGCQFIHDKFPRKFWTNLVVFFLFLMQNPINPVQKGKVKVNFLFLTDDLVEETNTLNPLIHILRVEIYKFRNARKHDTHPIPGLRIKFLQ